VIISSHPETRFCKADGLNIAYQVVGDGPFDLVFIPGFVSNVELAWDEPHFAAFLSRLASFSRLILFDKRGTGMSDRVPPDALPSLEERLDDLLAVLDAAGSTRPALFSHSEGANMAVLFAATYPERTRALIAAGIFAKRVWSEDYPWAPTPEEREQEIEAIERDWGGGGVVEQIAPSVAHDKRFAEQVRLYLLRSASPGAVAQLYRINTQIDTRSVLPLIQAPTLVMHRAGDRDANVEEGRWIASQIPGARFVELEGDDHLPWTGDADTVLDHVEEFLTGVKGPARLERVLATILFTDLVESTATAAKLGDAAWHELLDRHDALTRDYVERYRGSLIKQTGDGWLSAFDGPARAVECALALRDAFVALGLQLRAGIHTGEVERREGDLGGIAVHLAARVESAAAPGEVLVTRTVIDLTAGSHLTFEDRGEHELRGVPGSWRLAAASS
jgi:class 3 adenylate cyclase